MAYARSKTSLLISFEGIEGSGKSTQIQLLKEYFSKKSYQVHVLREPGGTTFGEKLREAILSSNEPIHPLAEAHLFASSRAQLIYQKILPALQNEKTVVIMDRFIDSSLAYQGIARSLGFEAIEKLHQNEPLTIRPDFTFYLKIDVPTSFARQKSRGNQKDYFEKEKEEFYQKLIHGFDLCHEKFPKRFRLINGNQDPKAIHEEIQGILNV